MVETEPDLGSNPAPARPGRQVMVLYDPARPRLARLDGVGGRGVLRVAAVTVSALTNGHL
ncbi:hypothetical protein GCM10010517_63890 [Streptosporangium fragile]|uniref:Uncharacterized protein n=1 Tax=Streptosporangium fragile TaxID=46186 RepID=A0ABP6IMR0_9ACTN